MTRHRALLPLLTFILVVPLLAGQNEPRTGARPSWVKSYDIDLAAAGKAVGATGGSRILLVEHQINIERQMRYSRLAIQILNTEGVQGASDISVTYDPTYQSLTFCSVVIHRDGKRIDRLNRDPIQTFSLVTDREMHTYDRSVQATINLNDVRAGDIVEHSFLVTGTPPAFGGRFFDFYYLNHSSSLGRIIVRILSPRTRPVAVKVMNGAPDGVVQTVGTAVEQLWDLKDQPALMSDANTPPWFDPYQSIWFSEFPTWKDVARWAAPLYALSEAEIQRVGKVWTETAKARGEAASGILKTVRFVQDEIRYVSLRSGLSAYIPSAPERVLERRYGDCKDKSLLLVALLRARGIQARPVLVNTAYRTHVSEHLPSPVVFDHCIVQISIGGKEYAVDPTISNQGGPLDSLQVPAYGMGLVIDPSTTELTPLPSFTHGSVLVEEKFVSPALSAPASFSIRTTYRDRSADQVRSLFKVSAIETIERGYTDFYKNQYPALRASAPPRVVEDQRVNANRVIVEETYSIPRFWQPLVSDSTVLTTGFDPLVLGEYIHSITSGERTSPYYLGDPVTVRVETEVDLPAQWLFDIEPLEMNTPVFSYKFNGSLNGNRLHLLHEYHQHRDIVEPETFVEYITRVDKIRNQIAFTLTHNTVETGFKLSALAIILAIVTFVGAGVAARMVWLRYDPPARSAVTEGRTFGGWLILLGLGVLFSPVRLLYEIATTNMFFNRILLEESSNGWLALLIGTELVVNVAFAVLGILVILLFIRKRTSFPRMYSIFMAGYLVVLIADTLAAAGFVQGESQTLDAGSLRSIMQQGIGCAVWISYVWMSERVKETFVVRRTPPPSFPGEEILSSQGAES